MRIIVAADEANGIGRAGGIPWRLPEDLKRFSGETQGKTCIMGRRTFDSIPPRFRPLPHRHSVVVTRQVALLARPVDGLGGSTTVAFLTLEEAFAKGPPDAYLCGGADLYAEALKRGLVNEIYLTRVRGTFDCDVSWSGVPAGWGLVSIEPPSGYVGTELPPYQFEVWRRPS